MWESASEHCIETLMSTYQAERLPSVDVVLESDGTNGALALTDREVLVERSSPLDGRSIGTSGLVDVVDTTIRSDLC